MEDTLRNIESTRLWRSMHYRDTPTGILNKVGMFEDPITRIGVWDHELRSNMLQYFINDTATAFDTLRLLEGEARKNCNLYITTGPVGQERHQPHNLIDFSKVEAFVTLLNTYTGYGVRIVPLFERQKYSIVLLSACRWEMLDTTDFQIQVPQLLSHLQSGSYPVPEYADYASMYLVQHWLAYGEVPEEAPGLQPNQMH